jgi:hypothetical protein
MMVQNLLMLPPSRETAQSDQEGESCIQECAVYCKENIIKDDWFVAMRLWDCYEKCFPKLFRERGKDIGFRILVGARPTSTSKIYEAGPRFARPGQEE